MPTFPKLRTFSWASFDLANTIFAMNILSLYFPLWVVQDKGGSDFSYGLAVSLSLLAAGGAMPFLGALSDHLNRRMGFLIPCTLLCILCTAALAVTNSLTLALFLFAIAHAMYQHGLVFYYAMLPDVSHTKNFGKISGFGISLGYLGTLIGLILVRPFVLKGGHRAAFFPSALFFLFFSLPAFLGLKDSPILSPGPFSPMNEGWHRIQQGISHLKTSAPLRGLLWVYFFVFLGIQPVIYFMSVYAQKVIGLNDQQTITFYFIATSFTIVGSYLLGILTDRVGPKRTLGLALGGWIVGLTLALCSFNRLLFFCVGPLVGVAMGGTWLSMRVLVVSLSPKEHLAQLLGFMGFFARIASVLGPIFWGATVWFLRAYHPLNYRLALSGLILFLSLGLACLVRKVPCPRGLDN